MRSAAIKMIAVICALAALLSFTACGDNTNDGQHSANVTSEPSVTASANSTVGAATDDIKLGEISAEAVTEAPKEEEGMQKLVIEVGGKTFTATLYDNETARALSEMLPLTLEMSELNGNEKYYYLDGSLPTDPKRPSGIKEGDIMLYGSSCLVLFYESFSTSYSYTPIGHIDDADGLADALGKRSAEVAFELG